MGLFTFTQSKVRYRRSFPDLFKVIGWMRYLRVERGAFFVTQEIADKPQSLVSKKCGPQGLTLIHVADAEKVVLDVLQQDPAVQIDWGVIKRDQVRSLGHQERRGLQLVDAVASGYWYGLNRNQYGHTEDRYARMLHSIAYSRNGNYKSYGLKFFPLTVEPMLAREPQYAWVRELRG